MERRTRKTPYFAMIVFLLLAFSLVTAGAFFFPASPKANPPVKQPSPSLDGKEAIEQAIERAKDSPLKELMMNEQSQEDPVP